MTASVPPTETAYRYLTESVRQRIAELLRRYPHRRAVLLPALWVVQETHGYISLEAELEIARFLEIPPIWVHEVVTFYHMFHTEPVGRYLIYVCGNLSCALRGGRRLLHHLLRQLGVEERQTTPDGLFTVERVQCIGACELAPVIQVNGTFYGPMDPQRLDELLAQLRAESSAPSNAHDAESSP